ncbi:MULTISPECIES: hypothetical protein [unclassified Mesorhizobium]|nr:MULTISPECIES: hypothetical protein [unclassified Mesorhizobium]
MAAMGMIARLEQAQPARGTRRPRALAAHAEKCERAFKKYQWE